MTPTPCWVLIGGWIYCRCRAKYDEFVRAGCRVSFIGCQSGHCEHCWVVSTKEL